MEEDTQAQTDVFTRIRVGTAGVLSGVGLVRLEPGAIPALAELLHSVAADAPGFDPRIHFVGDRDDTLHYVFALDAMNFGSGWFPDLRVDGSGSGYRNHPLRHRTRTLFY